MTLHAAIEDRRDALGALCRRVGVTRLEVFGSAVRGDAFDPARSDVDLLVQFAPEAEPDLAGFVDFKAALEDVLGRPVDLVERQAIERSRNHIRRRRILAEVESVYDVAHAG